MTLFFLFVFGLIFGSFLNVVALRYDGEHFLFDPRVIGGRSECPKCHRTLQWAELIPLVSFFIQRAKCRGCEARIGMQYPLVELLTGIVFIAVPLELLGAVPTPGPVLYCAALIWLAIFWMLILVSYIDIRLGIIPDEGSVILGALAFVHMVFVWIFQGAANHSFLGGYALLFGFQENVLVAHLVGMLVSFALFELIVLITRGRGMGMGDLKLALPLGLLFGWPDVLFVIVAAFIFGAIAGVLTIAFKKKTMQGTLPFGPFLAIGSAFVFFFAFGFLQWYFKLLGM